MTAQTFQNPNIGKEFIAVEVAKALEDVFGKTWDDDTLKILEDTLEEHDLPRALAYPLWLGCFSYQNDASEWARTVLGE